MLFALPYVVLSPYSSLFSVKNWGKRGKSCGKVQK